MSLKPTAGLMPRLDHARLAGDLVNANPSLGEKISANCPIAPLETTPLLTEVLRFLDLVAQADRRLTPALLIDLAWHEFILHTRAYGDFCQRHFDRMLHHHPGGSKRQNQAQFAHTLKQYQRHFGPPPRRYWHSEEDPATTACGPCQAI